MSRTKRLQIRVAHLAPGDVLIPTHRTVVRVTTTRYTGPGRREVVLDRDGVRTVTTFGARTTVTIDHTCPAEC